MRDAPCGFQKIMWMTVTPGVTRRSHLLERRTRVTRCHSKPVADFTESLPQDYIARSALGYGPVYKSAAGLWTEVVGILQANTCRLAVGFWPAHMAVGQVTIHDVPSQICWPSALYRPPVASSTSALCNAWSLIGLRATPPTGTAHYHRACRSARIRCDTVGDPAVGWGPGGFEVVTGLHQLRGYGFSPFGGTHFINSRVGTSFAMHQRSGWWPPPLREGPPSSTAGFGTHPLRYCG